MEQIKNGIGGTYTLEYDNSTKFDNNGGDNIPDLSINYRVCTKIILEDGLGNTIPKNYSYKNGVSFSAFINGKKETDAFGFTEFTMTDATGSRTIHSYFSQPYSNFMHNRALAGAEKEMHILGSDNKDYGSSKKTYEIQQIETVAGKISYLARLSKTQNFINGIATTTSEGSVVFNGYNLTKKTDVSTDHYADSAHPS
ncbi:hypothetical protein K0V43_20345, partial [Leptospira sp. id769339]|nr:hypothetical protein [Leptospira sp. id769339]